MDPAVKAAAELTALFAQLEIPCEVKYTDDRGKYVVAAADLSETGFTLVEESPIVSWPTAAFLAMDLPVCFHCLRRNRGAGDSDEQRRGWTAACGVCGSSFCCDGCREAGRRSHQLLCPSLKALRDFEAAEVVTGGSSNTSNSASVHDDGVPRIAKSKKRSAHADEEGSITPEAVARCAAWLLARIATFIERQGFTDAELGGGDGGNTLSTTNSTSNDSNNRGGGQALVRQIFSQAAAPFDRLVGAPDSAEIAGVTDPSVWFEIVRGALRDRGVALLTAAASVAGGGDGGGGGGTVGVAGDAATSAGAPSPWVTEVVDAALSDATLRTFLGQIVLNAHAINDYILLEQDSDSTAAAAASNRDINYDGEAAAAMGIVPTGTTSADPTNEPQQSDTTASCGTGGGVRFAWVMKGAAVYSLLCSFNHSCDPNMAITFVDGTHEIAIKTTRPVRQGEEFNITYIPLKAGIIVAERREQLRGYFFTCRCTRCVAEDAAAAGKVPHT